MLYAGNMTVETPIGTLWNAFARVSFDNDFVPVVAIGLNWALPIQFNSDESMEAKRIELGRDLYLYERRFVIEGRATHNITSGLLHGASRTATNTPPSISTIWISRCQR